MNYLIFILFITFYSVLGLELTNGSDLKLDEQYCFHFSWLGRSYDDDEKSINCSATKYKGIPCIKPIEISLTPPNLTDMWYNKNRSDISCLLRPGYSCIRYTYNYNKKVVNTTYFCGKMMEDTATTIETGCYTQMIAAHIVEACACTKSTSDIPCNSSSKKSYSLLGIILLALFVKFT